MTDQPLVRKKRLILRLSSLGDVILSSSSLQVDLPAGHVTDWVVAKEYAAVLRGHPRIRQLWEFDRRSASTGKKAWVRFARQLWEERYDEVIDLHGSIRTRMLRILFWIWSIGTVGPDATPPRKGPHWVVASKQRFESWGFILFKKLWPRRWLSRLQVEVFSRTAGGTGMERPDLRHLIGPAEASDYPGKVELASRRGKYLCVMPGSTWPGKTWAAEKYVEVLKELKIFPVVMGTMRDPESLSLASLLEKAGVPHFSGVGQWNLPQAAAVLAGSAGYLGSDTGLALLGEAVGARILVIYGPTAPGLGFEPWRKGSGTAGSNLWCRPCGKIGNRCYRPFNRFLCLKGLEVAQVIPPAVAAYGPRGSEVAGTPGS